MLTEDQVIRAENAADDRDAEDSYQHFLAPPSKSSTPSICSIPRPPSTTAIECVTGPRVGVTSHSSAARAAAGRPTWSTWATPPTGPLGTVPTPTKPSMALGRRAIHLRAKSDGHRYKRQPAWTLPGNRRWPPNTGARDRVISGLAVLKAAAEFGASRPDLKSADVLKVADVW